MSQQRLRSRSTGFTMIELLVVISIIIILMSLAFPAFQAVQNSAKKTQAKNDLVQIVTAVNAFYTEYGKYPIDPADGGPEVTYSGTAPTNAKLLDVLRSNPSSATPAVVSALNPRQISFITPAEAKDRARPQSGISAAAASVGQFFDPWGSAYFVRLDANYDNQLTNPYGPNNGAGPANLQQGVVGWCVGKNGRLGGGSASGSNFSKEGGSADVFTGSGDVISWQ